MNGLLFLCSIVLNSVSLTAFRIYIYFQPTKQLGQSQYLNCIQFRVHTNEYCFEITFFKSSELSTNNITPRMPYDRAWKCKCGMVLRCTKCDAPKESRESLLQKKGDWKCTSCDCNNFANRKTCYRCTKVLFTFARFQLNQQNPT